MLSHQLNQVIAGSSILLLVVFILLLLTVKKKKELNHNLLLLFLLVNTIFLIAYMIRSNLGTGSLTLLTFFLISHTFGLLFGPVLYYYSKSIIKNSFRFSKKHFIHLIPFAVSIVYILVKHFTSENSWLPFSDQLIYSFFIKVHVLSYLLYTFILIKKYRADIKNYYSNIKGVDFYWLTVVLIGYVSMWLVDFLHSLAAEIIYIPGNIHQILITLSLSINFFFAVILYYSSIKHPEFFHDFELKEEKPKNEKNKLSQSERMEYISKLQSYMVCEKPYLNQNLTITELSEQVNIPSRYISFVINDSLRQNFFDFVNYYRVEESKKYLSDPKSKKMTVLEILYETGFNSKSTFNKVFKEFTGYTPTQYRRSALKLY